MATGSLLSGYRKRITDTDSGVAFTAALGAVALLLAFGTFLVGSRLTVIPVLAFVVVVAYGWAAHQAETARALSFLATVVVVLVLTLITLYLLWRSVPAFSRVGTRLFTRTGSPLLPMIWGTVVTTLLATAIAGPLGVVSALFIAEIAPGRLRTVLEPAVEVLAGIPSIVYGFLGFTVLNQYMLQRLELSTIGSLFVAGVVIGVMALPTVVSVAEDAISSVPQAIQDGAVAMGATDWQTMKSITLPTAFSGISAAVLLGVGRAVGEAMAVSLILGNVAEIPNPFYDVFGNSITLTSFIVTQATSANGLALSIVFAAGVVLFVTVMALSIASQLIEMRMANSVGGNR